MKRIVSTLLTLALVSMISLTAVGAAEQSLPGQHAAVIQQLPDHAAAAIVGAFDWMRFTAGIGCGAGVVALGGAALTGSALLGGPVGVYLTAVGTLAACAAAFA